MRLGIKKRNTSGMMQATVATADHILSFSPHLLRTGLDSLNNTPTQ